MTPTEPPYCISGLYCYLGISYMCIFMLVKKIVMDGSSELLKSTSLKAMCLFWFLLHSTLKCAFIFVIMGYAQQPYYYVPLDAVGDRLFSIRESDHVLQLHIALMHEHHSHQMWALDLIYPGLSYC